MAQNINLLDNVIFAKKTFLTAKLYLQIIVVWTGILLIIYALNLAKVNREENELTKLNITKQAMQKKVDAYLARANQLGIGAFISGSESIDELVKDYKTVGFSQILGSLAQNIPTGVWLNNFTISYSQKTISFKGEAISESLIPSFLSYLNSDPVFYENNFNKIILQKNITNDKDVKFTLSNSQQQIK
jgi:hypothetical protein